MKTKLLIILTLSFLTCFFSCKKSPLTIGKIVTVNRELPDFYEVRLNDDINLVLEHSNTNSIIITTGENIVDQITTEVKDGVLTISNTTTMSWIRPYDYERTATLYYKDITNFVFGASGTLKSTGTYNNETDNPDGHYRFEVDGGSGDVNLCINNCKRFDVVYRYGTSRVNLRGQNNRNLVVEKRSYGIFDARDLCADSVAIMSKTPAHSYIWANKSIKANILHHGNVYYKGEPDSISVTYGEYAEGKLIPF